MRQLAKQSPRLRSVVIRHTVYYVCAGEDIDTWQPTSPVGSRGGDKQAGVKACREESPDTSVQTGCEKICGANIHINCPAKRGASQGNRRHSNHKRDKSLGRDLKRSSNQSEI